MNPRRFFKKSALRVVEQGSSGNATSSVVTNAIDARTMSASELLSELKNHGCKDISDDIDLGSFTGKYDCGGGNTISYGSLRNGTKVFIEMTTRLTPPWQSDLHFGHPKVVAQELRAWSECNHPNVLGLLGLTISQERLGVVLSSVTNGNLVEYLIHRQCVNRYRLSVQICDGLVHLHEHAIIHGHLSGVNVYISHDGTPMLSLRLIHKHQTFGLTRKWLAPELIGKAEAGDKATDVYALGMTILETLTIYPPRKWHNVSYKHYYIDQKKRVPDRPEEFIPASSDGDRLWDTLVSCWSDQPERRPSASAVANTVRALI